MYMLYIVLLVLLNLKVSEYCIGCPKKVTPKKWRKMHKKMKMTSQGAENLVHVQQNHSKHFYEKNFLILLYIADITISMSNVDSFDIDQDENTLASLPIAQRDQKCCSLCI